MVSLKFGFSLSDRTLDFFLKRIEIPNFTYEVTEMWPEKLFTHQVKTFEFDVNEMSLSSYLIMKNKGDNRLTAIPVFLSRYFRHESIYVKQDAPYRKLADLKGKKIGLPEWQVTAAVWFRGFLKDEGIKNDDVQWFTYRAEERVPIETPAKKGTMKYGDWMKDICEALINGEVDAIFTTRRPPEEYLPRSGVKGKIRRLFDNPWEEAAKYYNKTGIFPIMHTVTIKTELINKYPNLPELLYDAFVKAKNNAYSRMINTSFHPVCYPFIMKGFEETVRLMGEDFWPYGIKNNWKTIEKFMSYMVEDGLIKRPFKKEEIFHNALLDT